MRLENPNEVVSGKVRCVLIPGYKEFRVGFSYRIQDFFGLTVCTVKVTRTVKFHSVLSIVEDDSVGEIAEAMGLEDSDSLVSHLKARYKFRLGDPATLVYFSK